MAGYWLMLTIPRTAFLQKRWSVDHAPHRGPGQGYRCPCAPLQVDPTTDNMARLTATVRGEPFVIVHREYYAPVVGLPRLLLHLEPYERGDLDGLPDGDLVLEAAG